MRSAYGLWAALCCAALAACAPSGSAARSEIASAEPVEEPTPAAAKPLDTSSASLSATLEAEILAVAASYTSMSRADGVWWAPEDCKAPTLPSFMSKAEGGGHGRKIYTLFAKDIASYAALSGKKLEAQPRGREVPEVAGMTQVIVKEAWKPVESSKWRESCGAGAGRGNPGFLAPVKMDGVEYRACQAAGLFVMYKPAQAREGTDEGWVYGTVQYEQRDHEPKVGEAWTVPRVTSAGRVASCMGCHTQAPHGRLFGLAAKD